MRKKQYETSSDRAWEIFDESPFATLALIQADGTPYAVTLSMARIGTTLYFHCAMEGAKIQALNSNSQVCVSAVSKWNTLEEKFTVSYASVILNGQAMAVKERDEKIKGLKAICQRYTPNVMNSFEEYAGKAVDGTAIYKIEVKTITGKEK